MEATNTGRKARHGQLDINNIETTQFFGNSSYSGQYLAHSGIINTMYNVNITPTFVITLQQTRASFVDF